MKKHLISIGVVLVALTMVWSAFGQEEEKKARRRREGDEEATRPRTRSTRPAATRGEGREGRRTQGMFSEEMAKIRERWPNMSEEEKEKFRAQMRERIGATPRTTTGRGEVSRVFEQQIARLKEEHQQSVGELRAILELAKKEKAKETAGRLEKLIAKHEKAFEEKLQALEERRQKFEQMRRERPGAVEAVVPGRKKAPEFTLQSFDGKQVGLSQYRGKIVVLEWLNFECPFSRYHYQTKNTMLDLAKKYKNKNVVWLAVNSTSHTTPEANQAFAKKYKLPFPILNDKPGLVGKKYAAKTTPHMFIIDTNGRIAYDGAIDNAPSGKIKEGKEVINYVDKALAELTSGKLVSTPSTKPYGCTVKYPK